MKNFLPFYLMTSLFSTLLIGVLTVTVSRKYRKYQMKDFKHYLILVGGLGFHSICYYFLRGGLYSMIGWILPLMGIYYIHRDACKVSLWKNWHTIALFSTGALSSLFVLLGMSFMISSLPFALGHFTVGFHLVIRSFDKDKTLIRLPFTNAFSIASIAFFLLNLSFPLWRLSPFVFSVAIMVDLVLTIGLLFAGLGTVLEMSRVASEEITLHVEEERTDKLVKNSKYSELGMMAAGIAHEINNPLAVIQARTTQLLRIYRDAKRSTDLADGLQQILYTSERINRTIQGVREFVHDERTITQEIKLKALIDDVLSFCGQRMKNHGVNLRFYNIENQTVWGNKIQIEQILLNLLNNSFDAIEFLPDKWIEVSAQQNDDMVLLFVKDSGHGIPKDVAEHMMEPFYSTKDVGKGTGLGLALARGIAEKHGGELRYINDQNHTTFVVELPKLPNEDWGLPMVQ